MKKSAVLNKYYEAHAQSVVRSVNQQLPKYKMLLDNKLIEDLKMAKFMLGVQQKYLTDIMRNIDRLHPITHEQIKMIESKLVHSLKSYE